jgi:FlaA1/EpsC-like NDP-sugar epimerase
LSYIDIDIQFSGIRPGEKLYRELLTHEEGLTSTQHKLIFIGKPGVISASKLDLQIKKLEQMVNEDNAEITTILKHILPNYMSVS